MNFQEKLFETTSDLRGRAQTLACNAFDQVGNLKGSFAILNTAGRQFGQVARRHAVRFFKQNATLATQARDEVTSLARTTFSSLTRKPEAKKPKRRATRTTAARRRTARAA